MRQFGRGALSLLAGLLLVELLHAQAAPPGRSRIRADRPQAKLRTAPPPEWDQATLEVFFADATQHLGPEGPRQAAPAAVANDSSATPASANAPAGNFAWTELISRETLEDEVKQILTELKADVRTPGSFKSGGFDGARLRFTLLGALFQIISEYDGDVRWKSGAKAWAERFGRTGRNCKAPSDAVFHEAKLRTADLTELIRGNAQPPAEVADGPIADWLDRRPLMSRLELAQQERLGRWTATPNEFERNAEALRNEAQLLAAMAQIIQRENLEFADDPGFRDHANAMQDQASRLGTAAEAGDYPQARQAASAINQSCEKCHADYRN